MHRLHPSRPPRPLPASSRRQPPRRPAASNKPDAPDPSPSSPTREDLGVGLKAAWYGAEALGDVLGAMKGKGGGETHRLRVPSGDASTVAVLPRADALAAIKADYDQIYFVSGKGAMSAYEDDCEFADPFASFTGKQRFVKNVRNLGSLLTDVKLDLRGWEERDDGTLVTRWTFSGVLSPLPWRPRLAAAGSTTHTFSPATGRVVRHYEDWESDPASVLRSLLKPAARVPSSRWEVAADAVDRGAWGAAYRAAAPVVTAGALLNAIIAAVARAAGGGGGGGVSVGEVVLWVGVGAGVVAGVLDKLPRAK